ncbi:MAG: hypothetical protein WC291_00225 [Thermodesulfovibrionales bacterium]|jgi:hypothetical protein
MTDEREKDAKPVEALMIWVEGEKVCTRRVGNPNIYVYGTKRSAFNALEKEFDKLFFVEGK